MNRLSLLSISPLLSAPLALASLLAGCVSFQTVHDGITRARLDETVAVGGVLVTPSQLLEDSRCPTGVQCITAGRVRIAVRIGGAESATAPVELIQGQPAAIAGGDLALVEVYPERRKDWTLYPDEYRFGFTFTRRP